MKSVLKQILIPVCSAGLGGAVGYASMIACQNFKSIWETMESFKGVFADDEISLGEG